MLLRSHAIIQQCCTGATLCLWPCARKCICNFINVVGKLPIRKRCVAVHIPTSSPMYFPSDLFVSFGDLMGENVSEVSILPCVEEPFLFPFWGKICSLHSFLLGCWACYWFVGALHILRKSAFMCDRSCTFFQFLIFVLIFFLLLEWSLKNIIWIPLSAQHQTLMVFG